MPALTEHQSNEFVKILYLGSSGSGKTGSLISLVKAGYRIHVIDMDNGLDALAYFIQAECPDKAKLVDYETVRDRYKAGPMGPKVIPPAKAFVNACRLMDKWIDDSKPEEWGPKDVLVIDSFTAMGKAAFEWAVSINPTSRDPRQWYKGGQDALDNILATVTSDIFKTNVIVMTHIDVFEDANGVVKSYASSLGKALGPKMPRYFNTMILAESKVMGKSTKRVIKTIPTAQLDLKNPAPMKIDESYPLETGLAEIFAKLKGKN